MVESVRPTDMSDSLIRYVNESPQQPYYKTEHNHNLILKIAPLLLCILICSLFLALLSVDFITLCQLSTVTALNISCKLRSSLLDIYPPDTPDFVALIYRSVAPEFDHALKRRPLLQNLRT